MKEALAKAIPQSNFPEIPSRAPKINKDWGHIDLSKLTAKQVYARHRAISHQVQRSGYTNRLSQHLANLPNCISSVLENCYLKRVTH
jgi:hypothetical protein